MNLLKKYPRKELLEELGSKTAKKMYIDTKKGETKHIGYVIDGDWWTLYKIEEWSKKA